MVNVKIKYKCSCGEEVIIRLDDSYHIDFPYCLKCGLMMSEVSKVRINSDDPDELHCQTVHCRCSEISKEET